MKFLLTSFCILISLSLFSQNWQLINVEYQYHFDKNGKHEATVLVDSINIIGLDTVSYLNRIAKCATCSIENEEYILKNQAIFLGREIINQNRDYVLLDEEVTFIETGGGLSDSWVFDTTNNIIATISAIDFETVLGNMDSTKTIGLSNGTEIKISKNHGIISYLDDYELAGIQSNTLNIGFRLPDFYDFYNFNVGDVFEYKYSLTCFGGAANCGEETYSKIEVLSKQVNINSIVYSVNKKELYQDVYCAGGAGCWNVGNPIPSEENIVLTYYNDDELLNAYNAKLIGQSHYVDGVLSTHKTMSYVDVDSMGLVTKSAGSNFKQNVYKPFYLLNTNSDLLKSSGPYNFSRALKEGFGVIINTAYYFELSESTVLVGSIKNGVQTGTIHNEAFFLGIKELKEDQALFSIFPNPSKNKVKLEFKKSDNIKISFLDILGKKILENNYKNKKEIALDISDLPKGVYFVKSETADFYTIKKFVKK